MKPSIRKPLGLLAALLVGANLAVAQTNQPADQTQGTQDQTQLENQTNQTQRGSMTNRAARGYVRLEQLIGQPVLNSAGEEVGEVERIYVNPRSGRVSHAVVGIGGFLGMGERLYVIPWQALTSNTKGQFLLNIDREVLRSAPVLEDGFDEGLLTDYDYLGGVYDYYGYPYYTDGYYW